MNIQALKQSIPQLQAIFFDFDGVILQSVDIKANAFINLFAEEPEHHQQAIRDLFYRDTGRSRHIKLRHVFSHILKRPYTEADIESLAQQFGQSCIDDVVACEEVEGAIEFLNSLPKHLKRFVVSGTTETDLLSIVEKRELGGHFDQVLGTPIAKEKHMALLLEEYGLAASKCLMFGDGIVDYQAAKLSNVAFVGIVKGANQNPFPTTVPIIRCFNPLLNTANYP